MKILADTRIDSLSNANRFLAQSGITEKLARSADGYYFFAGSTPFWSQTDVRVASVRQLSYAQLLGFHERLRRAATVPTEVADAIKHYCRDDGDKIKDCLVELKKVLDGNDIPTLQEFARKTSAPYEVLRKMRDKNIVRVEALVNSLPHCVQNLSKRGIDPLQVTAEELWAAWSRAIHDTVT